MIEILLFMIGAFGLGYGVACRNETKRIKKDIEFYEKLLKKQE